MIHILALTLLFSTITADLKADLQDYLKARGKPEHISTVSLSVSLPDGRFIDVAAGTTAYGAGRPVTPSNLFQIGSNTKAFTAVLAMKLEAQHKLAVSDTLGKWLPQYPAWKTATIHQLLDMTSGIPTYDNTMAWQRDYSRNPTRIFTPVELVAYVDPKSPLKHEWLYSNTGYIMTEMIEEKATGKSYTELVRDEVIAPTGIPDLYYYPEAVPAGVRARTVAGYLDNDEADNAGLTPMLGKSQRDYPLSWARAAGAIVATPHAMAAWARDLYRGDILTPAERTRMETLVSLKTANPMAEPTADDSRGFGLGVAKMYMPGLGSFWFYEGMTLGYRMVHAYFPKQNVIVALGINSQPRGDQNKSGPLVQTIVKTLQADGLFQ
ncbi:MAG TPA: serine hydrolase domain-containing protein [Candidatus Baltobacteraceae bacterium]|nr:serine hydrolase domain-containing protein [Candidatus Baltobacteraceae bacterium]